MKRISHLTEEHIEILASTWALKFHRTTVLHYKVILRDVKNDKKCVEDLPFFIVKTMRNLGYETPILERTKIQN